MRAVGGASEIKQNYQSPALRISLIIAKIMFAKLENPSNSLSSIWLLEAHSYFFAVKTSPLFNRIGCRRAGDWTQARTPMSYTFGVFYDGLSLRF